MAADVVFDWEARAHTPDNFVRMTIKVAEAFEDVADWMITAAELDESLGPPEMEDDENIENELD